MGLHVSGHWFALHIGLEFAIEPHHSPIAEGAHGLSNLAPVRCLFDDQILSLEL
jgi:hypothetical protein